MIATLIFFYPASVSKSLLIVLGTLPFSWFSYSSAPAARAGWAVAHRTPLYRVGARYSFRFPLSCKFYGMPACPCQGSWRVDWLLGLCVKCPISDCLAWRRSLDNSCPSSRSSKSSGKQKNIFGRFCVRGCTPPVRAGAPQLRGESASDRMRADGQG